MAKRRRKSTATKTRTITRTIAAKAPIIKVSAPRAVSGHRVRRHARRVRAAAISGGKKILGVAQNQLVAVGSAAGLAFLQKQGVKVPKLIPQLSTPANAGIIAWAAARFFKNAMLDHVATGMLCAGAYAYAAGAPIQGDVMGQGRAVVYGDDLEGDDLDGDETEGDEYD